ncbi:MAG TPA: family 16 glycosylhydrolase [Stenomitos sp.]
MKKTPLIKSACQAGFLLCSVLLSVLMQQHSTRAAGFNLVWSTAFSSSLKTSEWNIYNNVPFGSSSTACFMRANTWASGGFLNLLVNQNSSGGCAWSRPYASGALDTYFYKPALTYGRWVVRAKMPTGHGVTGYIGLFPVNGSWPPEIDIAEYIGKEKDNLFITQHYGTASNHQQDTVVLRRTRSAFSKTHLRSNSRLAKQCLGTSKRSTAPKSTKANAIPDDRNVASPGPLNLCKYAAKSLSSGSTQPQSASGKSVPSSYWTNSFHTYTLEWVPGQLRYYIDGQLRVTQAQKFSAVPNMMKLAVGTGTGNCGAHWVGCPEEASSKGLSWPLPSTMQVDFIKVYRYVP